MAINRYSSIGEFLTRYPLMCIIPSPGKETLIRGDLNFSLQDKPGGCVIHDSFEIEIVVAPRFPEALPIVYEIGHRIPRNPDYHINAPDSSLCLGSEFRLKIGVAQNPTLLYFIECPLLSYLYAVSHKLKFGGDFIFGALEHDDAGLVKDYCDILGVKSVPQVKQALLLLSMTNDKSLKYKCPCGCGQKLANCHYRARLIGLRKVASSAWFSEQAQLPAFKE